MENIANRLSKLEFHVKLLAESIDFNENPIASLVVSFNWSEENLDLAHDIFEKFDEKLQKSEKINWHEFEREFDDKLHISYQRLKLIILSFFKNDQWTEVCHAYASSFGDTVSVELKSIALSKKR